MRPFFFLFGLEGKERRDETGGVAAVAVAVAGGNKQGIGEVDNR